MTITITMTKNVFKILTTLAVMVMVIVIVNNSEAQSAPELMVTWKANAYVPPDYQGKVLPVDGTIIEMAMELVDNGRFADLSRREIKWLVNGAQIASGIGKQTASFPADTFKGNQSVDVVISSYRGVEVSKNVVIPIVRPEAAIVGGPESFKALPYFFNVSDLNQLKFIWSTNNQSTEGTGQNPDILNLEAPEGTNINLSAQIQSIINPLEVASQSIQFTKQ